MDVDDAEEKKVDIDMSLDKEDLEDMEDDINGGGGMDDEVDDDDDDG